MSAYHAEVDAQEAAAPTETPGPAAAEAANPALNELVSARRDLQDFLFSLGDFDTATFIAGPEARLADLREELGPISQEGASDALDESSFDRLLDLETDLRGEIDSLDQLAETLRDRASLRDRQLDDLAAQRARWDLLTAAASERDAPPEVVAIADGAASVLDETESALKTDRDAALRTLTGVLELQLDTAAFNREIRARRQTLQISSQRAEGLPLWSRELAVTSQQISDARATLGAFAATARNYLAEHGLAVLALFFSFGLTTLLLLKAGRTKVSEFVQTGKTSAHALAVFEKPAAAALLVGLAGVLSFAPTAPVTITAILVALLPWPAARLATTVFAKPLRLSVYVLAAALSIIALRPVYEVLPLAARGIYFLVTLAAAVAFYIDWRRENWSRALVRIRARWLRIGVLTLCAVLLVVLTTDALGYVGVANLLRTLTLGGFGYALIFIVLSYVLNGLILALLQSRALSRLSTVKHRPWAIVRVSRRIINTIAFVSWLTLTLALSGLAGPTWAIIESVLTFEFPLGALSIRVASLVAGLIVIWLTWAVSHFIRFVMQSRALDYPSAASGLTFAISKVLGYAILVAGFLLALAVIGVDLTRVTVLAGALGVGIGLGLQNIANNFVSGIILLFERPVQVNDIAKVDETIGTIKEIGIRSTLIQTFDGAEVIVPNADFMAKTVLNWTKSNRRRRAEIDVGVAYGSDPARVTEVLDAAAHAHPNVLHDPEPLAAFVGFGDSSLNFRLYVWLSDLADFLKAPSVIRHDILRRLNEAGIEIPFPQRDIRVTMAGDPSAAALGLADANPGMPEAPPVEGGIGAPGNPGG